MDALTPTPVAPDPLLVELARMNDRLDALSRQVAALTESQRAMGELAREMGPIGKEMMRAGAIRLADLEHRGYFAFGEELLAIVDRVVTTYSAEDVRALGDNVVRILDVVRAATQPEVLALAEGATDVVSHPESVEPMGVFGMLKAGNEPDVKRGLAVALEVLRQVGKGAAAANGGRAAPKRDTRLDRLAPKRSARSEVRAPARAAAPRPAAPRPAAPRAAAPVAAPPPGSPACAVPARPAVASASPSVSVPGFALTADGFLVDAAAWTREFAESMAAAQGVALGPDHWKVIEFARQDFLEHNVSPNIRRITVGTGLTTKDIYALFPKAPGKTAARIAGVPKPAGCL